MPADDKLQPEPAASGKLLRPFAIGPIQLPNNLILAPMAGISDRPYRTLCRRFGAGLAISEMVSSDTSLWGTTKSVRRLDYGDEPGPISVQIVGADPVAMARAARANQALGADIIDINMGCPAKKVCRVAAGSSLLRDAPLVARILEAVVEAVSIPVTLKIRTGWSPDDRNAVRIAEIARNSGIAALAVHGRTRACGYETPAEYETIRAIRAAVDLPLIANGDIGNPIRARRVLEYTGADAIMLGRAVRGQPWIFRDVAGYLSSGDLPEEPPTQWIRDLLVEHLESLYRFYGAYCGVRIARKHIAWYCRQRPGAARFRQRINAAETPAAQTAGVVAFFHGCPAPEDEAA